MSKGMSTEEYLNFHQIVCNEARQLSKAKNNDYAAPDSNSDDPLRIFRNFLLCEKTGICSATQGLLVRLSDKFSRLTNLLREGHCQTVKDESVEDTVKDIINYVILTLALRKTLKEINQPEAIKVVLK